MIVYVPGRLCLFGEHSDWAGAVRTRDPSIVPGRCLVAGTDQGIQATVEPAPQFEMVSRGPDGGELVLHVPMDAPALRRAAGAGDFFSYAAGAAKEMWERYRVPGVRIVVTAVDLPMRRGLSSSAAVCVLVVRAFSQVHGLGLSIRDEMELGYQGELASGSQCGRMDQVCAYGKRLVLAHFDGHSLDIEVLRPGAPVPLLIVDLRGEKDTRRILSDLNACFTGRDDERRRALRAALGPDNAALVAGARRALESGDMCVLGGLMTEAQGLFDRCVTPACPSQLLAPRLHAVLAHPAVRRLAWGGKGVGSQGDGAAQLVCRGFEEREALGGELSGAFGMQCLPLTIEANANGGGTAERVSRG